jgi:type IV secretion system protein VirB2
MQHTQTTRQAHLRTLRQLATAALIAAPALALAQADGGLASTTCGFLTNVQSVLNAVSIVVVTIAVIFSGYQIAFAHKRIGDVAPVFIGALLIGAATQIAKLFLSGTSGSNACSTSSSTSMINVPMEHLAALAHTLAQYA